jgi:hypothetical protein
VLAHWNNSPRIDMSLHSDTLFWFQANQYLLFLLNAACLAEKNKYQFYSLWFDPTGARTHDLPHSRRARWPLRHRDRWLETFTSSWHRGTKNYFFFECRVMNNIIILFKLIRTFIQEILPVPIWFSTWVFHLLLI